MQWVQIVSLFWKIFSNRQFCLFVCVYVCVFVCGCCSAHRQDWPLVYCTKRTVWAPQWCMCNLFFECFQFWPPWAQKTAFFVSSSAHKIDPMYIIPKWPATWIFMRLFKYFECFQFWPPGPQKLFFLLLLSSQTRWNPSILYQNDQLLGYSWDFLNFLPLSCQRMAAILYFAWNKFSLSLSLDIHYVRH